MSPPSESRSAAPHPPASEGDLDLARMRRERFERLQAAMASEEVQVLVALGGANLGYASGARLRSGDAARCHYERGVAVTFAGDAFPHVFSPCPEGLPTELPAAGRHGPLALEFGAGAAQLAEFLRERLGGVSARIGFDEYSAALFAHLRELLPDCELVDGARAFGRARICKTADELECIRRAQHINERAMLDVLPMLRPGVRQCDLTGRFLRRIFELGATSNEVDPIWQVMAPTLAENPFSVNGEVPFPCSSGDRFLREGDLLWVDTGIGYEGYASDFGRTWIVGRPPRPTPRLRDLFEQWREVFGRVREAARPGITALDLMRAASAGLSRKPWLEHFYLAHGVGLSSAEMPLVGTDLGEDFDASLVLEPGMVLVVEPAVWEEGVGGYRAEEILAVTEDGCRQLSDFSYAPFETAA